MRQAPQHIHLINGTTSEFFTNEQILRLVIPLARALIARRATGRVVMCVMRNHEHLVSLYYAAFFAGAVPFLLDPHSTPQELQHFLPIVSPCLVACDADRFADVTAAVKLYGELSLDDIITHDSLTQLAEPHDSDPGVFQPLAVAPDALAVLLPTSGSTGLPKATEISHHALLAHLPSLWCHHERFPTPTERVMFMSTAQWMTFTNLLTTCPVYRNTVIVTPDKSLTTILRIIEALQPTWLLLVPGTAAALGEAARPAQLGSLRTVVVTGAASPPETLRALQRLAPRAAVLNSYGMTEAQGFVALAHNDDPFLTIGKVLNIFDYKLVDDDGNEVKRGVQGELYLKSDCITKGYLKNEAAYRESATTDGWWRTGDVFTEDDLGNLFFRERKKFWFKYLNYQISPEELEGIICAVDGVQEAVVTDSARGAAAAVVLQTGARVTRDQIHEAVNKALIEYKRLRGGIAFVEELPRTHSGKLHRADCTRLIAKLIDDAHCI